MINKRSSLISHLLKNAIAAIIVTALLIACSIILLEYQQFITRSEKLEREHIKSQENILRTEVTKIAQYIATRRSQIKSILKQRIQQRVYDAHTIASNIYLQHHKHWSEQKIKDSIKSALRGLRFFNGDGYYFAHNLQGDLQLHGLKPESEGKNRIELKDSKGKYIVRDLLNIIKTKEEGFHSYTYISFTRPDIERKKLVFVKSFKPYNWMIGSGDYEENIEKLIQDEMLKFIDQLHYNNDRYIFVVNYQGTVLMNPVQRHLIGTNIWNREDPNGVKVTQQERKAVNNPEGDFVKYVWNKPSTSEPSPKLTFMKGIEDWQWMIGSGMYTDDIMMAIDDLKETSKTNLMSKLSSLLSLSILALVIIVLKTKYTAKNIAKEQSQFIAFFKNLSTDSKKIDLNKFHFTEFFTLAESANYMLDKQNKIESDKKSIELQLRQSQKMESLGKIVGGIAHDFNNLLSIMMGYSELLSGELDRNDKKLSYANHILDAAKRGSNLTKKLLNISRNKEQAASTLDLNQLLLDNEELFQKTITANISLDLKLESNLQPIHVDASDLSDALLNLCINSMHAMEEAEKPHLTFKTETVQLSVQKAQTLGLAVDEYITLSIIDNGSGIDKNIIEYIFEPFFTTKGDLGTGLGLSQVYAFMQRCNGAIQIKHQQEQGAYISLFFPKADIPEKNKLDINKENSSELFIDGNEVVLIVDNESSITELGAEILQTHGYSTIQAQTGEKALNILASHSIDLLICDSTMPKMNGDKLIRSIRKLYPDLPIFLSCDYSEQLSLNSLSPDEYNETIYKPFDAITLLRKVRYFLNQKADRYPAT